MFMYVQYVQIPRGSSVYRYLGKWKLVYKSLTFRSPSNAGRVFPCCSEPLCFKLTMSMEETRAVAWNILEHLGTLFAQLGVVIYMVFSLSSRPLAISLEQQLSSRFIEYHRIMQHGQSKYQIFTRCPRRLLWLFWFEVVQRWNQECGLSEL